MESKAQKDCEECKGSGVIKTEGIAFGRIYFNKEINGLCRDIYGNGKWVDTQCYCIGENDD